jgi:uncharacterized membrane protein
MRLVSVLTIAAPVERVWALTLDIESWPSLTPTMREVKRLDDGPLRVGSRARVRQPAQHAAIWTVTELEQGESFVWETRVWGLRMIGGHRLVPVRTGCQNMLTVDLEGRGAGLIGALLGSQIRRAITTENEGFRRAAEWSTTS